MLRVNRRNILRLSLASLAIPVSRIIELGFARAPGSGASFEEASLKSQTNVQVQSAEEESGMKIQYLEIVTTNVDEACVLYSKMHDVTFDDADPNLGGARTAALKDGGMLGIRGPLRTTEKPVVRPYLLVRDIKASVAAAADAGAEIAMPPTPITGRGQFAIVIQGGIESGLWQS